MIILGIETSCDETSASIVEYKGGKFKVLSSIVSSQIKIHQKTGGVVPEVAAREHVKDIIPVIDRAIKKAKIDHKKIDKIAVAIGPGLNIALLVGSETAKTLSFVWDKPIVPVNHLEGHIAAVNLLNKKIKYPALALLVSGGHTELVLISSPLTLAFAKRYGEARPLQTLERGINNINNKIKLPSPRIACLTGRQGEGLGMRIIGSTRDDASGECFDKCAKLLGLKYPGGPEIARYAKKGKAVIKFPRPMIASTDFDFSFSGLKTHVLYNYPKLKNKFSLADICASLEEAIVDVLFFKTKKAAEKFNAKSIILCGGVAANLSLRKKFELFSSNYQLLIPNYQYCTDNAAMIAAAAATKKPVPLQKIKVDPNASL